MQLLGCRTEIALFPGPELFVSHTQECYRQPTALNIGPADPKMYKEFGQSVLLFC